MEREWASRATTSSHLAKGLEVEVTKEVLEAVAEKMTLQDHCAKAKQL